MKEVHANLNTVHVDDFIIACADQKVLDAFRRALPQHFEVTYGRGPLISNEKFFGSSKPADRCCRRNIMLKTFCALSTTGTVF